MWQKKGLSQVPYLPYLTWFPGSLFLSPFLPQGWGVTLCNGQYGEAPLKRGTFFRMEAYEKVGISCVEV